MRQIIQILSYSKAEDTQVGHYYLCEALLIFCLGQFEVSGSVL